MNKNILLILLNFIYLTHFAQTQPTQIKTDEKKSFYLGLASERSSVLNHHTVFLNEKSEYQSIQKNIFNGINGQCSFKNSIFNINILRGNLNNNFNISKLIWSSGNLYDQNGRNVILNFDWKATRIGASYGYQIAKTTKYSVYYTIGLDITTGQLNAENLPFPFATWSPDTIMLDNHFFNHEKGTLEYIFYNHKISGELFDIVNSIKVQYSINNRICLNSNFSIVKGLSMGVSSFVDLRFIDKNNEVIFTELIKTSNQNDRISLTFGISYHLGAISKKTNK